MHFSKRDLLGTIVVLNNRRGSPLKLSNFSDYEEMTVDQLTTIVDQLIQNTLNNHVIGEKKDAQE